MHRNSRKPPRGNGCLKARPQKEPDSLPRCAEFQAFQLLIRGCVHAYLLNPVHFPPLLLPSSPTVGGGGGLGVFGVLNPLKRADFWFEWNNCWVSFTLSTNLRY